MESGQRQHVTAPSQTTLEEPGEVSEEQLLHEYHWLCEGLRLGLLTGEQQARIKSVETLLDEMDANSAAARAMREQRRLMTQRLDSLSEQINRLPDA